MSEFNEPGITGDQLRTELSLRAFTPTEPVLNRDELMFQAGWAAGREAVGIAKPQAAGGARWVWPTATGVMAAATLLLAVMLVRQLNSSTNILPSEPIVATEPNVIQEESPAPFIEEPLLAETEPSSSGFWFWPAANANSTNLLALRSRALHRSMELDEPWHASYAADESFDEAPPRATTSRELLKELLPNLNTPRPVQIEDEEPVGTTRHISCEIHSKLSQSPLQETLAYNVGLSCLARVRVAEGSSDV